jgi:hypothetical protein
MKKLAFIFVVLGSGLAAFGLSSWQMTPSLQLTGLNESAYSISAGWTAWGQLEITVGVMLLVCGLLLRRDSR